MQAILSVILRASFVLLLGLYSAITLAQVRGIYVTQTSLDDTNKINYLIKRAKAVGLNTFVIDYERGTKKTTQNIELVKQNGLNYVARIVVFPDGATPAQMKSMEYRQKKMKIIKEAIALGAQSIQLDYIRYNSRNRPSEQNVQDVKELIKWYTDQIKAYKIPVQIDVFGITSFHHEKRIGQYPKVLVNTGITTINPMVYPSHYEPFRMYSAQPYKTVYSSLSSLKEQIKNEQPVKIIAYIEASNYRYPLSPAQKIKYVTAEIKAAEDANIAGWYFWSANNIYEHVFKVLAGRSYGKTSNQPVAKVEQPMSSYNNNMEEVEDIAS